MKASIAAQLTVQGGVGAARPHEVHQRPRTTSPAPNEAPGRREAGSVRGWAVSYGPPTYWASLPGRDRTHGYLRPFLALVLCFFESFLACTTFAHPVTAIVVSCLITAPF
jgi:hypothetical protein